MNQPLVSVIIPTFNRAGVVRDTLASAQNQSYRNLEFVVVDDCSSDSSVDMLKGIGDPRLRIFVQPRNLGGADARNRGIDEARGMLVAFLDSDDRWAPTKIEKQVAHWTSNSLGPRDLLYTDLIIDKGHTQHAAPLRDLRPGERLSDFLLAGDWRQSIQTSSWLLGTGDARRVRFRSGLRRHQDWDFLIRAELDGMRFRHLREPLTIYCIDERLEHVGRLTGDLNISADWLESVKPHISREAYHTIWRWIALSALARAKDDVAECLAMQLRCLRSGALTPWHVARYLRRSLRGRAG